jgi:uncharacterized protein YaaN involved in tellurite resistance
MKQFKSQSARTSESSPFGSSAVATNASLNGSPSVLNTAMAKYSSEGMAEIRKLKDQLVKVDPTALVAFGDDVQDRIADMADNMLQHSKSSDLDFVGDKLTNIIIAAKGINIGVLNQKSRLPVIGGWLDKFRNTKDRVVGQFDLATTQVEKIVNEVDVFSSGISKRLDIMEDLYEANMDQYHALDKLVLASRLAIEELQVETDAFVASLGPNPDPYDVQQVNDAKNYLVSLDMKASNFERLKMAAYQTAPAIRLMQQNGVHLIEQFKLVKAHVVPNWKRQFMVGMMVDEQARGAQLSTQINDFTNQMARDTATKLKQTSIAVAQQSQRGIIDLTTIEHVQSELISGIQGVFQITEEGAKHRKLVSNRVAEMQKELQTKLIQRK